MTWVNSVKQNRDRVANWNRVNTTTANALMIKLSRAKLIKLIKLMLTHFAVRKLYLPK